MNGAGVIVEKKRDLGGQKIGGDAKRPERPKPEAEEVEFLGGGSKPTPHQLGVWERCEVILSPLCPLLPNEKLHS